MKTIVLIIINFSLLLVLKTAKAGEVCECLASKSIILKIDEKLNKNEFESLASLLKQIPIKEDVCKVTYFFQKL